MIIIKPSATLVDKINPEEILKKIELCGRVSHQSESKGNPEDFIRKIIKRGHESVLEHVSLTFHIICDRAIMAELTRHRLASFTVESTRYVKYDGIEVVAPFDLGVDKIRDADFYSSVNDAERKYNFLLMECPPEIARAVLPLCLKSELYMTANLREWRHILKLRTDKAAHPQMRKIAKQILAIFKEKLPVIVEDIKNE